MKYKTRFLQQEQQQPLRAQIRRRIRANERWKATALVPSGSCISKEGGAVKVARSVSLLDLHILRAPLGLLS